MSWYQQTHWRILVALGLGLVYGVVAALSGWGEFTGDWITPFGTIFLRLLHERNIEWLMWRLYRVLLLPALNAERHHKLMPLLWDYLRRQYSLEPQ